MNTDLTTTATFQTGSTISTRSACDYNCVWVFTVVSRTAKFVTMEDSSGKVRRTGINVDEQGNEWTMPFGKFSMAPVVRAERAI